MLSSDLICSIFARGPSCRHPKNPYHGQYNSLLCTAFPVEQFLPSLTWLDHNLDAMTVFVQTTHTTRKPVFVFLIAPNDAPATCRNAEVTMLNLLQEPHGLDTMHGVCVFGTRAAFYQYDSKRQIVLPKPQGQVNFDLDLATESGAVRFMEVTEEVKQMCREFMPDLEVPAYQDIHDP